MAARLKVFDPRGKPVPLTPEQWADLSAKPVLTAEETARYIDQSLRLTLDWIRSGEIPAIRFGRQWRVRRLDLDALWPSASREVG